MMMVSGTMPLLFFLGPMYPISLKVGSIPFPTCHSLPSPAKRPLCVCQLPRSQLLQWFVISGPTSPREMQRLKNLWLLTTYHVGEAGELGKLESSSKRGLLMPGEYWRKLAENRDFNSIPELPTLEQNWISKENVQTQVCTNHVLTFYWNNYKQRG